MISKLSVADIPTFLALPVPLLCTPALSWRPFPSPSSVVAPSHGAFRWGRIRGAPEVRTKCDAEKAAAREARDMLAERLRPATAIELREVTRGKYFRLVAEVLADGVNLSALLLERGLARPYDGAVQGSARSVRGWGQ